MLLYSYVGDVNLNLICCICHSPFLNPVVTTTCSHTFCRACIGRTLERQPCCPVDRYPLSLDDLKPENLLLRNMVDELIVECPQKSLGCKITCQRQLLDAHLRDTCQYVQVPCSEEGCDQMVLRRDVGKHTHDCIHRLVSCPTCGTSVAASKLETHTGECSEEVTECVACNERLKRGQLNGHFATCSEVGTDCSQSDRGCPWTGKRKALPKHLEICPYEAIKGFFGVYDSRISVLRDENTVLRQNLNKAEASIHAMMREVAIARRALSPWWRSADSGNSPRISSNEISGQTAASFTHALNQTHSSVEQQQQQQQRRLHTPDPIVPDSSYLHEGSLASNSHEVDSSTTSPGPSSISDPAFLASYFPPDATSSTSSDGFSLNPTPNLISNPSSPPVAAVPPHPTIQLDAITRHLFPYSNRFQSVLPPPFIRLPEIYQTQAQTTPSGPVLGSSTSRMLSSVSPPLDANATMTSDIVNSPTLASALHTLQSSITSLSHSLDLLARRTDIALTTENLRMNEEVGALRAIVHGLRMQVHGLITEKNFNGSSASAASGFYNHHPPASSTSAPVVIHPVTQTTKL